MTEAKEADIFDFEKFKTDFISLIGQFAENDYGGKEERRETAKKNYEDLLEMCAEALLSAPDKTAVYQLIHRELVVYVHPNGVMLFGAGGQTRFWENLTMAIASKASRVEEVQPQPATPEPEMGRNFLEVIASLPDGSFDRDREAAMQVGDYIEMTRAQAKSWGLPLIGGNFGTLTKVRVIDLGGEYILSRKIEVEAEGVRKRIFASLFFNHGTGPHPH